MKKIFSLTVILFLFILTCATLVDKQQKQGLQITQPLAIRQRIIRNLKTREEIGSLLNYENFTSGAEVGVQEGLFAKSILTRWTNCQKYFLIDIWQSQKNYADIANVNDDLQNDNFEKTKKHLAHFDGKTIYYKMSSTEAAKLIPDKSLDFIYIDARHDYCGVKEDLETYWPKLKDGGLFAGHDYVSDEEALPQDWKVCQDGRIEKGAVKRAVDEFSELVQLQTIITYRESSWNSWLIRKPMFSE